MFTSLTYNMKGFDTSVDYICSEVDVSTPDIVFLQETWHLSNACDTLRGFPTFKPKIRTTVLNTFNGISTY